MPTPIIRFAMTLPTLVKICGTTSTTDARLAVDAGAGYLGLIVNYPPSPRHVALDDAIVIAQSVTVPVVAVTVNQSLEQLLQIHREMQPSVIQLHGDEPAELVVSLKQENITVFVACSGSAEEVQTKARHMQQAGADAVLIDARVTSGANVIYGGTGHTADWDIARQLADEFASTPTRVILAGGLTPQNVEAAIEQVQPWMVDVVSGVEQKKGVKDAAKVAAFIKNVKRRTAPDIDFVNA